MEEKRGMKVTDEQNQYYYGTFQGVANYYSPPPPLQQEAPPYQHFAGFPQPSYPLTSTPMYSTAFYPHRYQTITGYVVDEEAPIILHEHRLPCCGIGTGWFLFVVGFFLGGIPWHVGTLILLFSTLDIREKPGHVACAIASFLAIVAVTLGVTQGTHTWYR